METMNLPIASTRLFPRVAPWAACLGLFASGGWGVYWLAQHPAERVDSASTQAVSSTPISDGTPTQASSAAAKNEIRQLFSSQASVDSRYGSVRNQTAAPQLPPLAETDAYQSVVPNAPDAVANPFAAAKLGALDRYDSPTASPPSAEVAPAILEAAPLSQTEPDVTRGQEPSGSNPLRDAFEALPASSSAPATASYDGAPTYEPPPTSRYASLADPAAAASGVATSNPFAAAATDASPQAPPEPTLAEPPLAVETPAAAPWPPSQPLPRPNVPSPTDGVPSTYGDAPSQMRPAPIPAQLSSLPDRRAMGREEPTPTPGLAPTLGQTTPGTGRPGERQLEGMQSPVMAIQKLAPTEIQVGKKCTFAVRVRNNGQRTAHGVQIHDETPMGTQLLGTVPKANISGSQVVWDLGSISPNEERTVEMEILPTDEGEIGSVATVSFGAQASVKTRCTRPELALRLTSQPQVMVGEQHLVQVEIANPGSGDATHVLLTESVPPGVTHQAGAALEFEVGTLPAGQSRQLELLLTAEQAGRVTNTMVARADANLQVESSVEFEVVAPDLRVSIDGPQRRFLERPATYTVSVENPGTASAKEVQLVTKLPKGMQFVSANNMGEYDTATHSVYWSLAELPANEQGSVELVALPVSAGEHLLEAATKAQRGLEDRTETSVLVEGIAALMFEVVDVDDPIEVGGETTYEIRVLNQGSKGASNVQVVAHLPPGLRALSAQGEARHVVQPDRVVFEPLPMLAPKADVVFRVRVQGVQAGDQRIKVQIATDEVQEPITKEESTRVYADQ